MLVDTHAHIYLEKFDNDRDAMIDRARSAGVTKIVMPAIDVPSVHRALALCERYEGLYVMAALHPSETKEAGDEEFEEIVQLCEDPRVVAIGESGLDYYWDRSFDDRQVDFLRRHVRLAMERDLPLILHLRDRHNLRDVFPDVVSILREESADSPDRLRGIFHCFTGTPAQAGEARSLGFLVGLGGVLTFKNSGLDETVRSVPMEQIVLETDAPYLAPEPYRGKRNEPSYVGYVASKLAEVKEISIEEVGRRTSQNALECFGISN